MPFPTFKTKAEIPKGFEDEYEEKDGEWKPKAADDSALKTALDEERTRREAAEKLSKKAADELKKLENKQKAEAAGLTAEELTKLRADVKAELETEYAPHKETAEKVSAENRALKLDTAVKEMMGKAGVRAERLTQTWDLTKERFDLTADGKPMVKGKPGLDIAKYLTDTLKPELPEFFTGTKGSGGGASGQHDGAPVTTTTTPSMSPEDRLSAARAAGKTE